MHGGPPACTGALASAMPWRETSIPDKHRKRKIMKGYVNKQENTDTEKTVRI